ncbi:hypothetical protein D039_3969B, partial [Vibrio parahaemolyticus EKP-028]
SYLP